MRGILHIGPMKTGSTSIQFFLGRHRKELEKEGFYFPRSLPMNMSKIGTVAEILGKSQKPSDSDLKKIDDLREEISNLAPEIHSVIISGEMMGQRLRTPEQVAIIKSMFDDVFLDYKIITYLRRQDKVSISAHTTRLRQGQRTRLLMRSIDYEKMLGAWSEIFGFEAVTARIFDRSLLLNGDVVRDFANICGIEAPEQGDRLVERNMSVNPAAQRFLSELHSVNAKMNNYELTKSPEYDRLIQFLVTHYAGRGEMPIRARAERFYAKFSESNERVRARWFPKLDSLFSDDFSEYPEKRVPAPNAREICDLALHMICEMCQPNSAEGQPRQGGVEK